MESLGLAGNRLFPRVQCIPDWRCRVSAAEARRFSRTFRRSHVLEERPASGAGNAANVATATPSRNSGEAGSYSSMYGVKLV